MIAIVIPIYNEEKALRTNASFFDELSKRSELIFVDGGSTDKSVELAAGCGEVLHCEKGRARQMNHGARDARNDILLFLHADMVAPPNTLSSIENGIRDKNYAGGCLTLRIDKEGVVYRMLENFGNIRARLTKVFYGDQGIFVRKDIFLSIGGFPEVPIMEDVIFSKRLRRSGKTTVLSGRILASSRRWDKVGVARMSLLYSLINLLYLLRFPLERIKLLYDDSR